MTQVVSRLESEKPDALDSFGTANYEKALREGKKNMSFFEQHDFSIIDTEENIDSLMM